MQTQSVETGRLNSPTLFGRNGHNANPIIPAFDTVREKDETRDILEILQTAANQSEFAYLFEIPGTLFGRADLRVVAIRTSGQEPEQQYFFILCSEQDGIVSIVAFDDAPGTAQEFFHSYTWVLSSLSELKVIKNLH